MEIEYSRAIHLHGQVFEEVAIVAVLKKESLICELDVRHDGLM